MDTVLGTFDFVTANLGTVVTLAFAGIGVLSQAAAVFNLAGLAQVSTTLHDAVQFIAGNWGFATNTVKVVETYRTAGPAAALAELAALAAPAAPKDGGGSVPPAAALLLAVALGAGGLVACAPLSAKVDKITGTTLEQRCEVYRAGETAADALAASFPELTGLAAVDDAAVKALCDQPSGALQVPKP
ncbi:MAG: hypothetical protein WCJ64_02535 [Rhodospirillaceae bacterium]